MVDNIKFSKYSSRFSNSSGIVELMEDLGAALNVNPDLLFLGGGNPANIPEFESCIAKHITKITKEPESLRKLIGVYQSPQGSEECISALASYFRNACGWEVTSQNITISNGSQSAFYSLFNMLAGDYKGNSKRILFPLVPEYLGYIDQGEQDFFYSCKPRIELLDDSYFRYQIDFENLQIDERTAAICISCPTNPTGRVLSEFEFNKLDAIAKSKNIPLIIDCAYGYPFPNIIYESNQLMWNSNTIFVLSLSKLGLPGVRTGIVIASSKIIQKLVSMNTIMNLASGNMGPTLMTSLLVSKELGQITQNVIGPYYRHKRDFIIQVIQENFSSFNYKIHVPQGAFFVWLWFPDLLTSSSELYERLKNRGVLIMDGNYFFYGLDEDWDHQSKCVRLSYCQDNVTIEKAIKIMAEVLSES